MKDRIQTIIRDWLNTTFDNPDAIPKLVVAGLADEIDKHRWEIYRFTKEEYDLEDIDMVADNKDVELTDDERLRVLHNYQNSEYQDSDTIDYFIDEVMRAREENKR